MKALLPSYEFQIDEPLSRHTTLRIGGKASYFVVAQDDAHLQAIQKFVQEKSLPYFIIGAGSNLLISDQGFSGVVIKLGKEFTRIRRIGENRLICGAGARLNDLVKTAVNYDLRGACFLYGIPGTLGGAIKNNAGAFNHSISEIVEAVQGKVQNSEFRIPNSELKFSYRKSSIPKDFIITQAVIKLSRGNRTKILAELERIRRIRRETQPWGASAGSVFKNPLGSFAGKLLDEAGLKGMSVGDAYVSNKHANFILNRGKAKFNDVLELIQIMKMRVEIKTGIILEEEIEIIPK